ncbi:inhibitor of nuclear factor kappa-B kinase-interacting protein [Danio rerio]|uniref:IKBKB-interacting protein n=1 Tax=Danio rerio TaxID=7955 RepID=A0A1L1QZT0_DANRE|nr:inhibitor of nuclear factor kappa-B kinase-interacting protein [Danio rerio]|eukprot:XP_017210583.1 inhibitor of nuclear factor kappa-B kinase-interacting protein isoform X14 [Danio rerio]
MKQRQRSSQRSRDSEEETRSERSITAAPSERAAGLSLSRGGLLYLCVPLILSGLYVQQGWRLSEVEQKYEALLERSRSSDQMEEKMEEISAQLQASADAVSHLSELHRSVSSIVNTSADLRVEREASAQHTHTSAQHTHTLQQLTEQWRSTQMEQEASAQHAHTLQQRLRTLTELWRSRQAEAGAELHTLQTQTRAAHAQLTQQINAAEASVSEQLTELQAGIGRNARALERTEQEDTHHLQELLQRHTHRLALLQQHSETLAQHTHRLTEQVEDCAQHTHSWQETQRPRVEECVRALLKLRAQVSAGWRRMEDTLRKVEALEETTDGGGGRSIQHM